MEGVASFLTILALKIQGKTQEEELGYISWEFSICLCTVLLYLAAKRGFLASELY